MTTREDETLVLLRAANPVDAGALRDQLGDAGLDDARARLAVALDRGTGPEPSRPRSSRRRVVTLAVGGLAAAALGLAALPGGDDRTSPIEVAAAVAAEQPASALASGEYAYLRMQMTTTSEPSPPGPAREVRMSELWVGADGSGRTASDVGVRDARYGPGRFAAIPPFDIRPERLPTEPTALAAELRRRVEAGASGVHALYAPAPGSEVEAGDLLMVIAGILAHPLATPELRSALYRVAATLDGVTVEPDAQDPSGRPASVIRLDKTYPGHDWPGRYELFYDPQTSALLAQRLMTVDTLEGEPLYTVTTSTVYEEHATVASVDERP